MFRRPTFEAKDLFVPSPIAADFAKVCVKSERCACHAGSLFVAFASRLFVVTLSRPTAQHQDLHAPEQDVEDGIGSAPAETPAIADEVFFDAREQVSGTGGASGDVPTEDFQRLFDLERHTAAV